jgi:preprotein translocase subunit SecG
MHVTTKTVLKVTSTLLFVFGAFMLAATIVLGWLYLTQRDAQGFVASPEVSMSTDGYAFTSTELDLGSLPEEWIPSSVVGTFQVRAQSESGASLFIGVGPSNDVSDFLADVSHSEVTRFGNQKRLSYSEHGGTQSPQPPTDLGFWTVSSQGAGQQTLDWEPESGQWTLVIMNSDAAEGLDIAASLGVKTPWILIGLLITGVLTLVIVAGAIVLSVLASKHSTPVDTSDTGSPQPAPLSS